MASVFVDRDIPWELPAPLELVDLDADEENIPDLDEYDDVPRTM